MSAVKEVSITIKFTTGAGGTHEMTKAMCKKVLLEMIQEAGIQGVFTVEVIKVESNEV